MANLLKRELDTLKHYKRMKAQGLKKAWEFAGMDLLMLRLLRVAVWLAGAITIACILTHKANAFEQSVWSDVEIELTTLKAKNANLRELLGRCLDRTEQTVTIGKRIYLCGIVDTGEDVKDEQ